MWMPLTCPVSSDQQSLAIDDMPFTVDDHHALGLVFQQHVDALGAKARGDQLGDPRVLAHQDARRHLDLGHPGTQAREGLGQLASSPGESSSA